jgi:hypothetical protein
MCQVRPAFCDALTTRIFTANSWRLDRNPCALGARPDTLTRGRATFRGQVSVQLTIGVDAGRRSRRRGALRNSSRSTQKSGPQRAGHRS